MKLAALCCTYLRPAGLGQLIECFLRQDYPSELRELVILDDAGQYENQAGAGWRLVSTRNRFRTLGEKRNACAALASPDAEGFLVADDDDIYLPHWFRSHAEALRRADWSHPSLVLVEHGDGLQEGETRGLFHACWAFRREAFDRVCGYGPHNSGEDQELASRLAAAGVTKCDPCEFAPPFFIYVYENGSYHVSFMDDEAYQELGSGGCPGQTSLSIGWSRDWDQLPVLRRFSFAPHVDACDGKIPVEIIGPVDAPGRDGPTNGMYALQKAMRQRIEDGLDWLSIKSLPASNGALPWFWCFGERRYATWWDAQGQPFVQGPNVLFLYSGTPRIDREECAMLDAGNCRAMFCHSDWYHDLIAKHRGPTNQSPIVLWPYPIDPWPGEPLPDQYDLLIYAKNGHRPQLLEHLAELFPRNVQIHYGSYQREELFEAARRSRTCAYLADDDHGPLALEEILLAGCPTVGVRTGASFVRDGVTGCLVDRLPPGADCLACDDDQAALAAYLDAVSQAQALDRRSVRELASVQFDTQTILTTILDALDACRTIARTGVDRPDFVRERSSGSG
ncbi:MAG TPA: hypothetical protein VKE94_23785 [Gemmataceae bacterium]|nr:hypothetical protein [Gemmataceae bacterium]